MGKPVTTYNYCELLVRVRTPSCGPISQLICGVRLGRNGRWMLNLARYRGKMVHSHSWRPTDKVKEQPEQCLDRP